MKLYIYIYIYTSYPKRGEGGITRHSQGNYNVGIIESENAHSTPYEPPPTPRPSVLGDKTRSLPVTVDILLEHATPPTAIAKGRAINTLQKYWCVPPPVCLPG